MDNMNSQSYQKKNFVLNNTFNSMGYNTNTNDMSMKQVNSSRYYSSNSTRPNTLVNNSLYGTNTVKQNVSKSFRNDQPQKIEKIPINTILVNNSNNNNTTFNNGEISEISYAQGNLNSNNSNWNNNSNILDLFPNSKYYTAYKPKKVKKISILYDYVVKSSGAIKSGRLYDMD